MQRDSAELQLRTDRLERKHSVVILHASRASAAALKSGVCELGRRLGTFVDEVIIKRNVTIVHLTCQTDAVKLIAASQTVTKLFGPKARIRLNVPREDEQCNRAIDNLKRILSERGWAKMWDFRLESKQLLCRYLFTMYLPQQRAHFLLLTFAGNSSKMGG